MQVIDNPFAMIERRFNHMEHLLMKIENNISTIPQPTTNDKPLNIEEAAKFLGISKQTLYQNINRVPHKKRFGRLYFFKEELLAYLNDGEGIAE